MRKCDSISCLTAVDNLNKYQYYFGCILYHYSVFFFSCSICTLSKLTTFEFVLTFQIFSILCFEVTE